MIVERCSEARINSDISGERLWIELKRVTEGRNAGPMLRKMLELNIGQYLGKSFPLLLFYSRTG